MFGLNAGLAGIERGATQMVGAASRIAQVSLPEANVDLVKELVDMQQAKLQVKASAAVVRTANETIGTLIDTFV
jgi:flagellar basal body rod protein FlgG